MYNQQYGQPPAQDLPFPAHQLMFNPVGLSRGNPPFLPQVTYLPNELQQFYPLIVSDCIDAIQSKCNLNPLRVFLFNQMAQNGFNNMEFAAFVDAVVKIVEMQAYKTNYADIPSASHNSAQLYAELNVAANTQKYPGLLRAVDQSMIPHLQGALRDLGVLGQDIAQFNQLKQRAQQSYTQQGYGQPAPNVYAPQGYTQPQQQFAQPGFNRWKVQGNQPSTLDAGAVSALGAGAPSGAGYTQPAAPVFGQSNDPVAQRFENTERMKAGNSLHVQNIQELRRQKEAVIMGNVPTQTPNTMVMNDGVPEGFVEVYKARDCKTQWQPSEQYPVVPAFDPNTSELFFQVTNGTEIKPLVKKKEKSEMDINKHLIIPSYVKIPPAAAKSLDTDVRIFETMEAAKAQSATETEAEPLDMNVAYKDNAFYSETSTKQLWFNNEVALATMKRSGRKTNVFRSCGVLLDPLVCSVNPKAMIADLAQSETFSTLCAKLASIESGLVDGTYTGGDAKALTFINHRLTKHLNDFLKHCLAVPNGWVDSFMDDAKDVIPYLEKRYGAKFAEALRSRQKLLIDQALAYGDADFEKDQNSNLFPFTDVDVDILLGTVTITYFYNNYTLTSLDLFAHELKAELPKEGEVSCGIFSAQTPTLRQIVENVFTHERALKMEFSKHLIQTADKIVIEVTKSPIQDDFFLMAASDQ